MDLASGAKMEPGLGANRLVRSFIGRSRSRVYGAALEDPSGARFMEQMANRAQTIIADTLYRRPGVSGGLHALGDPGPRPRLQRSHHPEPGAARRDLRGPGRRLLHHVPPRALAVALCLHSRRPGPGPHGHPDRRRLPAGRLRDRPGHRPGPLGAGHGADLPDGRLHGRADPAPRPARACPRQLRPAEVDPGPRAPGAVPAADRPHGAGRHLSA